MRRRLAVAVALLSVTIASTTPSRALAVDPACTGAPFADEAELRSWHQFVGDLGARPTASSAHRRYLRWLRKQLRRVPGLRLTIDRYAIAPRQLERSGSLTVVGADGAPRTIPVAGPIPYTRLTGARGVDAPIVYLPRGQAITAASAGGRIVVRERPIAGVPYGLLRQLSTFWYDPRSTLDPAAIYERESLSRDTFVDVQAAQDAGAAGLVMIEPFPRAQVAGEYQPYRGFVWALPGVVLGADEGRALLDALASGTARGSIGVRGTQRRKATTWNLIATLPGASDRTIVVASHTDGMNPIWDNGPLAMLALARHFASMPASCRPATLEFAFTSAHLYLSEQGAERYAAQLVPQRDAVPLVVVLEHLGAAEFAAVPRTDGPGRAMTPTGDPELTFVFTSAPPPLVDALDGAIAAHGLERTAVVPFSAGIANGEGRSYDGAGFPTIAVIASPWPLRFPAFGMETIDVAAMRRMTLAFRDVVLAVE